MAPRAKFRNKNKSSKFKRKNGKDKQSKYKTKNRKTYSLYQTAEKNENESRKGEKRKREHNQENYNNKPRNNKNELKIVKAPLPAVSSEDEEEEEQDALKQLQNMFGQTNQALAIDSSSESEIGDEDELGENSNDEVNEEMNENDDDIDDDEDNVEINQSEQDDISNEDPFIQHFQYELHENLLNALQNKSNFDKCKENWPELGDFITEIPKYVQEDQSVDNKFTISERKTFAPCGKTPKKIHNKTLINLHVKTQIECNVVRANKALSDKNALPPLTSLQKELFSIINNYQDLYYPQRTFKNAEEIRFIYALHAINHVLKTRTKVVHHNSKLVKMKDVPEEFRDQGLTRPKVLIVVPFKDAAYKIIQMLIDVLIKEDKGNVMNKMRFIDEFTGGELIMPKKNPKPEDYELLFAGNSSDDFKIGLSVTKKTLKLYSDFYSSDIIIASPLGLRYIIGAEGEAERDYDFLASIEVLILDQTEIFLMQNWDHLMHLLNHLHLQPKDSHGTDFSRVRTWSLNGWAKYYRQTIIISTNLLPEINSIFNKKCLNFAGKVRVINPIPYGSIRQVYMQLPHIYRKFTSDSAENVIEDRFNMFINHVLPEKKEPLMKQTLIYVSSYFDYVRLRNYFKKEDVGFVQICEYSKDSKIARARDMFYHGDAHFLLYTERYHFFNRKRIKGIRHLVFYQPPNFPHFYFEMCNLMQEANMNKKVGNMSNMTVTVLYSKYDVQQLSAIVGTERAMKMVSSDRNVHMLLTD